MFDFFNWDWRFWAVAVGATIIKVASSQYFSWSRAILTVFAALFTVYVFTDPLMHYLQLEVRYRLAIAALLALTGEGFMRMIIAWTNDPKQLAELVMRVWRQK